MDYKYLSGIKSPQDIKSLNLSELNVLCEEIRHCIINTVATNGGHLASNLGAVELTVALHYVFDSPTDAIIFDVGHQSYTHKLLTGRFSEFHTLRQENGISGFMRPDESEHDIFISGHSSTAISSAYGLLKGKQLAGKDGKVIAVVGDGAMTGGMVYEALNNCGRDKNSDGMIIILNDNNMSISKNVGALARYLGVIREKNSYFNFKRDFKRFLAHLPLIGGFIGRNIARSKDMLKHRIYRSSNIFEGFGFEYFGPTDGHDLSKLINLLNVIKKENKAVVLHTTTVKGKGYHFAEEHPELYHGVGAFSVDDGVTVNIKNDFSGVFGDKLCELAEKDNKICAITAAMPDGTGLYKFEKEFPDRFFDVGIAEQHAVTFSAGLSKGGMKPFFAVYSSFLQRSIDQIIHDTAIADLNVTLCVDRAGFVGADGETHQGLYDVSLLTSIPNISVFSPSNYDELRNTLKACAEMNCLKAIRYPRGSEPKVISEYKFTGEDFDVIGSGDTAVVTYGIEFANVYEALAETKGVSIIKLNKIFPINDELFNILMPKKNVYVFEESYKYGSIGEKIGNKLCELGFKGVFNCSSVLGFIPAATVDSDFIKNKLDSNSVKNIVSEL